MRIWWCVMMSVTTNINVRRDKQFGTNVLRNGFMTLPIHHNHFFYRRSILSLLLQVARKKDTYFEFENLDFQRKLVLVWLLCWHWVGLMWIQEDMTQALYGKKMAPFGIVIDSSTSLLCNAGSLAVDGHFAFHWLNFLLYFLGTFKERRECCKLLFFSRVVGWQQLSFMALQRLLVVSPITVFSSFANCARRQAQM